MQEPEESQTLAPETQEPFSPEEEWALDPMSLRLLEELGPPSQLSLLQQLDKEKTESEGKSSSKSEAEKQLEEKKKLEKQREEEKKLEPEKQREDLMRGQKRGYPMNDQTRLSLLVHM